MKILTNIRFAQTAGIAQVVFAFLNFVENSKNNNLSVVAVNIANKIKKDYRKKNGKKISTVSMGLKIPNIAEITKKAKNLDEVEKKYEEIIASYQKVIQKEKPDIILINGTYFMPWCLFIASKREEVPAVLHYHGVLTKETQNWKKHQRSIFLEMEKSFDKKDLFYIFPSKVTKNTVEKEVFGHKISKCAILPNPVLKQFSSKGKKMQKTNIGVVSRWTYIKNIKFCEKFAKYNQKKGAKFILNIISDLDVNSEKHKNLSTMANLRKPTNNRNLASFYRNMGVIISPSHFETYGNVAKESIASGTPALVNKNMGVSETYKKLGLNDWIINFDSIKNVYRKIEDIIGETVNKKVIEKINKNYSTHKIFSDLVKLLNNVV